MAERHIPHSGLFNGINAQATLADDPTHDVGTGDFSLWIRMKLGDNRGANPALIGKWASNVGYTLYVLPTGKPYLYLTTTTFSPSGALLPTNEWKDLLVTLDRDGLATFYLEGVSIGTVSIATVQGNLDTTAAMSIGNLTGFGYCKMNCAEAGLWKRVLTPAEALALTIDNVKPTGSAGLWKATPTQFEDVSGNAKHLAYSNVVSSFDTPGSKRVAVRNMAASVLFTGTTDYVSVPNTANMTPGAGSFAVALTHKPTNLFGAGNKTILQYNLTAYANGYLLYQPSGTGYLNIYCNFVSTSASFPNFFESGNNWERIFVTFNAVDLKIRAYRNGRLFGTSAAIPAWNITATGATVIGSSTDLVGASLGNFADVSFYKGTVPTDAEIEADFFDYVQAPLCVHRFKMDENTGTAIADSIAGNTATLNLGSWSSESPMKSRTEITEARTAITVARTAIT